jgi:hypothetical protein
MYDQNSTNKFFSTAYIYINSYSSKKALAFFLCFFLQFSLFSQARLVLKDDAYLVLNTAATTGEVFVVLDNGNANALSTSGTGGNIITKHEKNQIKWNIGTNIGNYTIPFTSASTATNTSKTKIPSSVNITGAGTGSGNIKFSSFTDNNSSDNYKVSDYKPSDVTNMDNGDGADNSNNVVNRFWIIDANGYTDKPDVNLSFTYDQEEVDAEGNDLSEANIFPQRWNSTASQWHDVTLSGTLNTNNPPADPSGNTVSAVTVAKENFFRSWALVSSVALLPVELISFEPKCINNQTVIKWTTAAEINNSHFEIQHSTDGNSWSTIDSVQGAGNSTSVINYEQPVKVNSNQEVDYYRLKQVDFDGRFAHSDIKLCICDAGLEITSLYPNPSDGEVNILINSTEVGTLSLKIYDTLGKLIVNDVLTIQQGANVINNVIQGEGGRYFITVEMADGKLYDYDVIIIK